MKNFKVISLSKKTILKSSLILIAILLMALFKLQLESIVFIAYFLVVLLFSIESRISIVLGLILLLMSAVALIFQKEPLAETYAEYAYFFLVIGVIMALVEHLRKPEEEKD